MSTRTLDRLLVVALLVACAPGSDAANATAQGDSPRLLRPAERPMIVVGTADGPTEQQLFQVTSAFIRHDGALIIANAGDRSIRSYRPDGSWSWSTGRDGDGPGEFRRIRSASPMHGDTIVVWDPPQRRLTYLDGSGSVVATAQLVSSVTISLSGDSVPAFPTNVWALASGHVIAEPGFLTQVLGRGANGVRRDTIPLFLFSRSGQQRATIGPIAGGEMFVHDGSSMLMPFGRRLLIATLNNEIYVADGRGPIVVFDTLAEVVRTLPVPIEPTQIAKADFDAYKERMLARASGRSRPTIEAMLNDLPQLDSYPLFTRLVGGSDGVLWLQLHRQQSDSIQNWVGFTPNGIEVAKLELSADFEVMDLTQEIVTVLRRDELDTEQILVFRLVASQ